MFSPSPPKGSALFVRTAPARAVRCGNHEVIGKIRIASSSQQGREQGQRLFGGCWMNAQANDAGMCLEREHGPITKMTVQRYQHTLLDHGARQNVPIVRPGQAHFFRTKDVVTGSPQGHREINPKHLVKEQAHTKSAWHELRDFGIENGRAGKVNRRLDVKPGQFRIPCEERVPTLVFSKLVQDDLDRNSGAFDDWLAATDTGIDFDTVVHTTEFNIRLSRWQLPRWAVMGAG